MNKEMEKEVIVRIPPSPTGKLHIGVARTALFNYLFAKHNKGKIIFRFEDTDRARSTKESEKDIADGLNWLGISWDKGPYYQTERLDLYKKCAKKLLDDGYAYYCYCTPEELEHEREEQKKRREAPKYSGHCLNLTEQEKEAFEKEKRPKAIRLNLGRSCRSELVVQYEDMIKGKIRIDLGLSGDPVIVKCDGIPLYNFANVVDDYEMGVTHVIRGGDLISSTPIQILLYKVLGWSKSIPQFAHLSMILNPDKSKMSKRKDPVSITDDFRARGYLPEAMVNFMAFLGWNPKSTEEIFSMDKLIKEFDLSGVGKSAAIFDQTRLDYLNGHYIRSLSDKEYWEQAKEFMKEFKAGEDYKKAAALLEKKRIKRFSDLSENTKFFFEEIKYDSNLLVFEKSTKDKTLSGIKAAISAEMWKDQKNPAKALDDIRKKTGLSPGDLYWPIRFALSGQKASPSPEELMSVMPKDLIKERLRTAERRLEDA